MPQLPLFEVNTNPDGWGPTTVPSQFLNRPYAPFNKSERLWKIADFVRGRYGNRYVLCSCCLEHTAYLVAFLKPSD